MSVDANHELAVFLRTRRERLTPGDVSLPERQRVRRTPGLRREEVAELAGVSVDYVVRLEQGRGLRPSPEVLEGLAWALRLTDDERAYLFDLAGRRPVRSRRGTDQAESMKGLISDLSPLPAMLVNHRFDILAWNDEMTAVMIDFGTLPAEQRNTLWLCLFHPELTAFYSDRERVIREGIADLRAAWAAHRDDKALAELVHEFTSKSEEFARLWALGDVKVNGRGVKALMHPMAGPLTIEFEVLIPLEDPDHRLVIYRAADAASQAALDTLTSHISA